MNNANGFRHLCDLVLHQLKIYRIVICETDIKCNVPETIWIMDEDFRFINSSKFQSYRISQFNPLMYAHWMFLCIDYQTSFIKNGKIDVADLVYYPNQTMHSIDWFYALFIHQGTTIGGSIKNNELHYPKFDGNDIFFYQFV